MGWPKTGRDYSMNDPSRKIPESGSQIVLYQTEDGRSRVQVRLENDTVWLTQNLMAELYQTTKQNIRLHIQNNYEEGEHTPQATVKKDLTVRQEGSRSVKRLIDYYNLANESDQKPGSGSGHAKCTPVKGFDQKQGCFLALK